MHSLGPGKSEPVTHFIFPLVIIARLWVGAGVGEPNVTENQQIGISHKQKQ